MKPLHVAVVFGTRPEAVKMAPLVLALKARPEAFRCTVIVTAQHREMMDQVLAVFGIVPDHDLNLMRPNQTLAGLTARVMTDLPPVLDEVRPDLVLVQGDTTTVLTAALAAFYGQIPVGHVEAGLRTTDRYNPFPEEINRRLTTRIATLHFAPTAWARDNLQQEGIEAESLFVSGNTVIDALQRVVGGELPPAEGVDEAALAGRRLLLVTAHRRENLGEPLAAICRALRRIVEAEPDTAVVFAMHRNPKVRETVRGILDGTPRVQLIEPPDYLAFVGLMRRATLLLTDSGGIQEEAPALGKPVLVLRRTTERPEGVSAGTAKLIGTDEEAIVSEALELLRSEERYAAMSQAVNPYGDGEAAARILQAIEHHFGRASRPADYGAGA